MHTLCVCACTRACACRRGCARSQLDTLGRQKREPTRAPSQERSSEMTLAPPTVVDMLPLLFLSLGSSSLGLHLGLALQLGVPTRLAMRRQSQRSVGRKAAKKQALRIQGSHNACRTTQAQGTLCIMFCFVSQVGPSSALLRS